MSKPPIIGRILDSISPSAQIIRAADCLCLRVPGDTAGGGKRWLSIGTFRLPLVAPISTNRNLNIGLIRTSRVRRCDAESNVDHYEPTNRISNKTDLIEVASAFLHNDRRVIVDVVRHTRQRSQNDGVSKMLPFRSRP